jgi:hypothetical protein
MAITNTRTVQRIETYPAMDSSAASSLSAGNPTVMVVYQHTFDDSSDAELPVTTNKVKHLQRYIITVAEDGTESSAATDVTGEDQLVQDICGALWTD